MNKVKESDKGETIRFKIVILGDSKVGNHLVYLDFLKINLKRIH